VPELTCDSGFGKTKLAINLEEKMEEKCTHEREDGFSAFINFGDEDEQMEQCILCGKVITNDPYEDELPVRSIHPMA